MLEVFNCDLIHNWGCFMLVKILEDYNINSLNAMDAIFVGE